MIRKDQIHESGDYDNDVYWVLDGDGELVEGNPETAEDGCVIPHHAFSYQPAEFFEQDFCSAMYMATGTNNDRGLTARFYVRDIKLQMADMKSMSAQMEAEINGETKETDLDL